VSSDTLKLKVKKVVLLLLSSNTEGGTCFSQIRFSLTHFAQNLDSQPYLSSGWLGLDEEPLRARNKKSGPIKKTILLLTYPNFPDPTLQGLLSGPSLGTEICALLR